MVVGCGLIGVRGESLQVGENLKVAIIREFDLMVDAECSVLTLREECR